MMNESSLAPPTSRSVAPRRDRRSGFTLIEMIVVIGIIVMMASLMGPTLATMFSSRTLDDAGSVISTVLNQARNEAVTQKRRVAVVFCRDGLRTFREPKPGEGVNGDSFEFWKGEFQAYTLGAKAELEYDLHFAKVPYEEIPEDLQAITDGVSDPQEWRIRSGDIALWFDRDGTIDFGRYSDVPTYQFLSEPVESADIELRMLGNSREVCWVDIRPTGRTTSKVEELERD